MVNMGKEVAGAVEKHGVGVKSVEHLVLVLDSGGSTCKLGISGDFDSIVYVIVSFMFDPMSGWWRRWSE